MFKKYYWFLLLLASFLIRLPYWQTLPTAFDEVNQTVYAYQMVQDNSFPLVGNDEYAGPFYFYLLAALIRLGFASPVLGRAVVLIAGSFIPLLTYIWLNALTQNRRISVITSILLVANPDLILINSHLGGTTFIMPFFTTLGLALTTISVKKDSLIWFAIGFLTLGIALQTNPIAGLFIAGVSLWSLIATKHNQKLGRYWPVWPILGGVIVVLMYSPVIYFNLAESFQTIDTLEQRSYLWEDNPTVATSINNFERLTLQQIRQVSGVLAGDETWNTVNYFPLLFFALMILGLVICIKKRQILPLLIISPFLIILPIFSSHYGFLNVGRFTTLLIPVWMGIIGLAINGSASLLKDWFKIPSVTYLVILTAALFFFQLYNLVSYFEFFNSQGGEWEMLALSKYIAEEDGEKSPVYLSSINKMPLVSVPYIPHAVFLFNDIHHEFLEADEIIGKIFESQSKTYLLVTGTDAERVQNYIPLKRVEIQANRSQIEDYGLYIFNPSDDLTKPEFVQPLSDIERLSNPNIFETGITLLGCEDAISLSDAIHFSCYFQKTKEIPYSTYMTFAHLFDEGSGQLIAQDDHQLGQIIYPINGWAFDEVVKETYTIFNSYDGEAENLKLLIGIYTWPSLERLSIANNDNNVVELPLLD